MGLWYRKLYYNPMFSGPRDWGQCSTGRTESQIIKRLYYSNLYPIPMELEYGTLIIVFSYKIILRSSFSMAAYEIVTMVPYNIGIPVSPLFSTSYSYCDNSHLSFHHHRAMSRRQEPCQATDL
jgi:hypothetical protein